VTPSHYANQAVRVIATVTLAFQHLCSSLSASDARRRRRNDEICHQPQDSPAHTDFIAVWQISLAKLLRAPKPSRGQRLGPLVLINQPISQGLAGKCGRPKINYPIRRNADRMCLISISVCVGREVSWPDRNTKGATIKTLRCWFSGSLSHPHNTCRRYNLYFRPQQTPARTSLRHSRYTAFMYPLPMINTRGMNKRLPASQPSFLLCHVCAIVGRGQWAAV
jgi:hypothetical protein